MAPLKLQCNNREGTCDTCLTSGFRIWPASLGCRRGGIQEFVHAIMPGGSSPVYDSSERSCFLGGLSNCSLDGMEDIIAALPDNLPSQPSWRSSLESPIGSMPAELENRQQDKWDHLCGKVVGTRLFGQEFVELFEILARYQREAARESGKEVPQPYRHPLFLELICMQHPLLNSVADCLSYSVDLYHRFVAIDGNNQRASHPDMTSKTIMDLRISLLKTLSAWLSLCLRGRLADFPIAFLVAVLTLCSLIIYSDTVYALKKQTGELVWTGSAREYMMTLRSELLPIAVDLLGVVAKGSKPLRFQCFAGEPNEPRSSEGMRLMADDAANFDIMSSLQQWVWRHRACFLNDSWAETLPYAPGPVPRPIQSMSRFIQMGYGSLQDA